MPRPAWRLSRSTAVLLLGILLSAARADALPASSPSRRLVSEDRSPETQQPQPSKPTEVYWILLVGDSKVGKTSMLLRFLADRFDATHQPTAGAYSKQRTIRVDGKEIRLQVWDTAGQEAFRKPVTSIYRNVQAVLVVFDPNERATFDSAQSLWLPEVKEFAAPKTLQMLVSSKSDVGNPVRAWLANVGRDDKEIVGQDG
ncbi:hypothetical protein WJX73_004678 [Symbiochloris irregularis]|uniref:Uncharacterized protein n=1 Tax=Symbiochloris irregularis TaxID=706552 RepID=A0AAW1P1B7_9CHLO